MCYYTHYSTHTQDPLLRCWHTSKSGGAGLTPEINTSPCHARPCKAAARPDIFMRRVFATTAGVSAEQRRCFCRDPDCQGGVNYDSPPTPHRRLNKVHRSAGFLRKMSLCSNTEEKNRLTDKRRKNVCLFDVRRTSKF